MRSIIAVALVVALCTPTLAPAQQAMTAGDLQQLCQGSDHVSRNACRIYILGITQGVALGISMARGKAHGRPCVPATISAESLEETVKARLGKDLTAHPADGGNDAAGFIGMVLAQAYPCAKEQ
jgi:Rap1a immunity proteins